MKRNRSFDVLKGVACLFVIANHFDRSAAEYDRLAAFAAVFSAAPAAPEFLRLPQTPGRLP